ncbi:hypothetical protein [Bradyrhizobium sp. USDA 4486]
MAILEHTREISSVRDYDAWIIIGYASLALLVLVALYFAASGPGFSADDVAVMTILP